MDNDELHYERFKRENTQHDAATLDEKYAAWKKSRATPARDMTSSETPADKAPRYESFLESFGRAIAEVTTVPAGPDTIDTSKTGTKR